MKLLAVILPLALAAGVFGQAVHRNFGSVIFPGGTTATSPGITRGFGSVVFPGGAPMQPMYGGARIQTHSGKSNFRRNPAIGRGSGIAPAYIYAFPVFVGGYDNSNAPQEQTGTQEQAVPQEHAVPIMIEAGPDGEYTSTSPRQTSTVYQPEQRPETLEVPAKPADPPQYLLAFKDHSIFTAVAYWVDGDTLHYFTAGNIHNQASMSLIDRPLTERLNRELGIDFTLPPAK
jgi:hypothetical protein